MKALAKFEEALLNRPDKVEIDIDDFCDSDFYKKAQASGVRPAFAFGQLIRKITGARKVSVVEWDGSIGVIHLEYEKEIDLDEVKK